MINKKIKTLKKIYKTSHIVQICSPSCIYYGTIKNIKHNLLDLIIKEIIVVHQEFGNDYLFIRAE